MNVALRGVAILAELLLKNGFAGGAKDISSLLCDFETRHRAPIDARLEENHARGLEMDQLVAASVERMRKALAAVAASKEMTQAYCMRGAGY
jgi:2-polyprenyl-6-methoxyphenol hydroxylase-like FAD-dependent oxidoreductase